MVTQLAFKTYSDSIQTLRFPTYDKAILDRRNRNQLPVIKAALLMFLAALIK